MSSLTSIAVSLAALLLLAGPAVSAPGQDTSPVRLWSVSKVEQGAGELPVANGAQVGGDVFEKTEVGRVVFNLSLPEPYWSSLPRDGAFGALFSSADGAHYSVLTQAPSPNPLHVGAVKGSVTHLDEYQAYVKRAGDASLRITLSGVLLQTVDDNGDLASWECASGTTCEPVRTIVRFHARAYAASVGGDFFTAGGTAYLEGHQHAWQPGAATSADSPGPLWGEAQFDVDGDADDSETGASGVMALTKPRRLNVPLDSIRPGDLFAVHVSLEAEAVDDRGGESAAQAAMQDPQELRRGLLLTTHGLEPRANSGVEEPPVGALPPATCPGGAKRNAGVLQLSDAGYTVDESEREPMVLVTRTGGSHGTASVTVTTQGGSAQAGSDFDPTTTTTVRFADGDTSPRLVEIPLREDDEVEPAESFTVGLADVRCAGLGATTQATVTIVDDDQVPTPPLPPGFTIGGTVDGLQGAGLVLMDLGTDLAVSGNGQFTFPGTLAAGQTYEVTVKTQPQGSDQVCTVQHGAGTVSAANVTDVVVHCETSTVPSGLDPTFGSGGRVSTPVGGNGHGEAVVIQPGGGIVTAGWHGTASGNDFALTRHDSTGQLDHGFGTNGIASTDLGGADDEAYDAAALPDGGIVVVGRTDAAGVQKTDFGIVRYGPDGIPDPGFGTGGVVRTDVLGGGDQANAVAVQPDGKIVVAGFATRAGIDGDLALVRYNADGTLDTGFGAGGLVTTDLGTRADDARAVVIQPDGRIVVTGTADEDVALARYLPDGTLDPSFGTGGSTITDFGFDDVANGVALSPTGDIVVAGYTLGAKINRDFLLARYHADGALDTAFGDHGAVKTDVGGGDDFAENLTVDAQGRIVLVGRATSPTILDLALVRYHPDGTPDTSFGTDGILTADFHGRGEFGQDVMLDAEGRIVAAGYTADGADTEFALMRATP